MSKDKLEYRKYTAFIDRQTELQYLRNYINEEPESIFFIHGPKSSGKTTLLHKFLEPLQKEQKLNVKFMDLCESFANLGEDFFKAFLMADDLDMKKKTPVFFKIDAAVKRKLLEKRADPFKVMKAEFLELTREGIKPVLIIDELQALEEIYFANDKNRLFITALFNFFVALTKQAHLVHIIVASSDGCFLNTVYNDSRLKKCAAFYKVDYLAKHDVMRWLLNLEKYSKITAYRLTEGEAGKIWDTVGGSFGEIRDILTELFDNPIEEVLRLYKKKIKGMIEYYIGMDMRKEKILEVFLKKETAHIKDFIPQGIEVGDLEGLLQDMVRNNILYFDPTEAIYYPQGKSYRWGIRLYFEQGI
ncbi:MAG: ATP-binding protein [Candidatus Aminicenantes bacterium]|nr:ATP-binding protein [Candidatus Aminicenantes bacterium]